MNNVSLSFYSKRKKSINNILDQFVREFSGLFFHKYTYSILNNIKKSCEDLYLEKKKCFNFYQDELSVFEKVEFNQNGKIK